LYFVTKKVVGVFVRFSRAPLVVSNRFAALDTNDSGLEAGNRTQVPEQVLVAHCIRRPTDSLIF
jgi:hypothetical protein